MLVSSAGGGSRLGRKPCERTDTARRQNQLPGQILITLCDGELAIPSPNLTRKPRLTIDLCDCSEGTPKPRSLIQVEEEPLIQESPCNLLAVSLTHPRTVHLELPVRSNDFHDVVDRRSRFRLIEQETTMRTE